MEEFNKNQYLLSFIVIGYNAELYIKECLESVLKQMKNYCEVIFVDDGSVDSTVRIVKEIFCDYKKVKTKYIYQQNSGANEARLNGLKNASGKYVTFVDSDDYISDGFVNIIENNLSFGYDVITYNYKIKKTNGKFNENFNYSIDKDYFQFLQNIMIDKTPHYIWNKVYKRDFLLKINFFSIPKITMGDDICANLLIGVNKPVLLILNESLYMYRESMTSVSRKFNKKHIELIEMLEYEEKILRKYKLYDKLKKELEFQYYRVFFLYVVCNKFSSPIKKTIYDCYKQKNIIIKNNNHIKEFLKKQNVFKIILSKIFIVNYKLGDNMIKLIFRKKGDNNEKF